MITFKTGDLLADEAEVLVNTVNTVGVMGKGLALAFKNAFPFNFSSYQYHCRTGAMSVGNLHIVNDTNLIYGSKTIVNFPTKIHWRNPAQYEFIQARLTELRDWLIKSIAKSIAIPPLGCGNGGLEWAKVKPLIVAAIGDLDCQITIYEAN